jgi:hypothetical protein
MRAVKNGDFARFIGPDILYDTDIAAGSDPAAAFPPAPAALDNEQPEVFGGIQESIMVAQLRLQLFGFLTRDSR